MPKAFEEITRDVILLPRQQRVALAGLLLELDDLPESDEAEARWDSEIRSRIRAIDDGSAVGISYTEVMKEAESRLMP